MRWGWMIWILGPDGDFMISGVSQQVPIVDRGRG